MSTGEAISRFAYPIGKRAQSMSCGDVCRIAAEKALVSTRKVCDARVDSTQRGTFTCFAVLLRHFRIERLSARVVVHSDLTPKSRLLRSLATPGIQGLWSQP